MLKCDDSNEGPIESDEKIAAAPGMVMRSLKNWRKQAAKQGPRNLLDRNPPARHRPRGWPGKIHSGRRSRKWGALNQAKSVAELPLTSSVQKKSFSATWLRETSSVQSPTEILSHPLTQIKKGRSLVAAFF